MTQWAATLLASGQLPHVFLFALGSSSVLCPLTYVSAFSGLTLTAGLITLSLLKVAFKPYSPLLGRENGRFFIPGKDPIQGKVLKWENGWEA